MTMKHVIIGVNCVVLSCASMLSLEPADAASRAKKASVCVSAPKLACDPFTTVYCAARNACGGCAKWACSNSWLLPPMR
jgi:hypothetical protein